LPPIYPAVPLFRAIKKKKVRELREWTRMYQNNAHCGFLVLLPRKHQFKIGDQCADLWDHARPLGHLDAIRGRQWRTPQLRKGSQIAPKGTADLFWRGAERPRKRRNPRKARFSAQPKMRPNFQKSS
jgi:hypothetical protein